jgi:mannose-6-phosphate isomerase-like protein (cupin superfamily)
LDRRIDMFISDWHESTPRHTHGSLVLRDILTRGDNYAPPEKGAVFERFNFLSHGLLAAGASTTNSRLDVQQEIFYILSGTGEIAAGGTTAALHKDIAILMPAGLSFIMRNTGNEAMTMYVIGEPVPAGFRAKEKMGVTDERARQTTDQPVRTSPYTAPGASGHWEHITKSLFTRADGLASIGSILSVTINPMTLGEPHTHDAGQEEIWASIEGSTLAFLGGQIRVQRPGMAFMQRPDITMTHSNINNTDVPAKFLWFSASRRSDAARAAEAKPAALR